VEHSSGKPAIYGYHPAGEEETNSKKESINPKTRLCPLRILANHLAIRRTNVIAGY
jgi:hypothetical protein